MSEVRPVIPSHLERALMLETGYRCGMPRCPNTEPLVIEHIEGWAAVQEHKFEDMIVLCANCHGRKKNTSDPRHINRASLRKIKQNLMMLNGRYSDLERRIIDECRDRLQNEPASIPELFLPASLELLVRYLIKDGIIASKHYRSLSHTRHDDGTIIRGEDTLRLMLTPSGKAFIEKLEMD